MSEQGALPDAYRHRPEFEHHGREELFTYAKEKDAWIQTWLAPSQQAEAQAHLAAQLEQIVRHEFSEQPQVTARSRRIYRPVDESRNMEHLVASARRLPLNDDVMMFGGHVIQGALYGFSTVPQGESAELITYIRRNEPIVQLRTGRYVPLWSVPIQDAEIAFTEQLHRKRRTELARDLGARIVALEDAEQQYRINDVSHKIINVVGDDSKARLVRLHRASQYVTDLLQETVLPETVLDCMLEIISSELELEQEVSLGVTDHRVVITDGVTRSYRRGGSAQFAAVTPKFCVMGETLKPFVGLAFHQGDEIVRIDVRDVTTLK